jgi:lipoyl(octanoyl) transferase
MSLHFLDWGLIDYQLAHEKQKLLVEQVIQNPQEEYIIFCSHPSVVTLGRQSQKEDILGWDGPTYEVSRGGRATYHGPGQIVIYPILHLDQNQRNKDIFQLLNHLEQSLIQGLTEFFPQGLKCHGGLNRDKNMLSDTGVWCEGKKLASIGIAVKRWVTYHGAALNLHHDPLAFTGISPCGYENNIMTSLEEILNYPLDRNKVIENLKLTLKELM